MLPVAYPGLAKRRRQSRRRRAPGEDWQLEPAIRSPLQCPLGMSGCRSTSTDRIIYVPMCTSSGIVLVNYVGAEGLEVLPHLSLSLGSSARNADIARLVGEVIADHSSALSSPVDDINKRGGRLLRGRVRVCGSPAVHLGDVWRRDVEPEKPGPVMTPGLRHEFCLSLNCTAATGDSNCRIREIALYARNQGVDIRWTRLRRSGIGSRRMLRCARTDRLGSDGAHDSPTGDMPELDRLQHMSPDIVNPQTPLVKISASAVSSGGRVGRQRHGEPGASGVA